jgi:mono/diheme cytochrome c family protein
MSISALARFCNALALGAVCIAVACAPQTQTEPAPVLAEEMGSPQRGLAYAEANCASCHAVAAGAAVSPLPEAPAFQTVANTPGMTGLALRVWLQSGHETMPHLMVEPEHADDVWAYIDSLKQR